MPFKLSTYLALVILMLSGLQASAQQYCGTTEYSEWLSWYHDHKNELAFERGADTSWLYVPMTIHVVGTDAGNGYYPQEHCFRILCQLNEQYVDARIRFYLHELQPFVYHANSEWYEHNWQGGSEMILTTKLPARVNAYIVADPAGNCGYAWHDAIVMGKGCSGSGNTTWAHEVGHHLSLPHPFYGWEGESWNFSQPAPNTIDGSEVERTDGSNCHIAGDRFCDTSPDYLSNRWQCNNDGESLTIQKDPDGVSFRSDATLIMGYASDVCSSRFTEEQIEAMRANLQTEHDWYLQTDTPGTEIDDSEQITLIAPIDTAEVQFNQFSLEWEPVPNARYYAVQVAMSPSFPFYVFQRVVDGQTTMQIIDQLPNNRLLYWRVRAYNDWDHCLVPSQVQTGIFKTKNLTSTNQLEQNVMVSLSPNPVESGAPAMLNIFADEKLEALMSLHDAGGRLCQSQILKLSTGSHQVEINTSELAPGFYFLSIQNDKGTILKRVIVL